MSSIKLTEAFVSDLMLLANKIAVEGKIQPLESLEEFTELVKKHYGKNLDWFELMGIFQLSSMYFQLYAFRALTDLFRAFDKTGIFNIRFGE